VGAALAAAPAAREVIPMGEERITMIISRDGKSVQIEGHGFTGGECKDLTRGLEAAIGDVKSETLKDEYHETTVSHHRVKGA
jgi:hypothetical protein